MRSAALLPVARQLRCASTATSSGHSILGPAVRSLLIQYDISQKDLKPTGPKGNLLKTDVLHFIDAGKLKPAPPKAVAPPPTPSVSAPPTSAPAVSAAPKAAPTPPAPKAKPAQAAPAAPAAPAEPQLISKRRPPRYTDIPLTNMRSVIARRLCESKQGIPHTYAIQKIDSDNVNKLRAKLKKEGISVSINDFIIKACACALRAVPELNVKWMKDHAEALPNVDISVAVATPAGLITPIVFKADTLGVSQIGAKVRELAKKARANKLTLEEFQGGTFTVSNLGMYGSISHFTAIINPPQAAIMAIGGGIDELETDLSSTNRFQVTLCFDGRAITVPDAHRFLEHFAMTFKEPDLMVADTKAFADFSQLL
uniref:Dihydrolipoyl dehydrogenase-binding protein n=1 Tax=Ascaris suum TaxID=6253 RepID=Q9XYS5_ASCSU|nr:dihydrolipoyl dehydrogenase-binding protein [Ascaris suum]